MKILGWALTIFGGLSIVGTLMSMTKPGFNMDGIMLLSLLTAVLIFIIGLLILKKKK